MPDPPALQPLYTAEEMRAAEERYPGFPGSAPELMERAGTAVAREALRAFPDARRFAVVCGSGANGGDGRIAARALREAGRDAVETTAVEQADVIVDALFGTGFKGAPRDEAAATIERMNAAGVPVVAVDLPSGVDASTGEVAGTVVQADLTVTFHGCKLGLAVAPGRFRAGEVVIVDIGLEEGETAAALVLPEILELVPRKRASDNKYSAGSVLIVGGAAGMTGAVCLAAEAAFRADAGYVVVAVPEASLAIVETKLLEPVKLTWAGAFEAAGRAGAVALGPGLGRTAEAKALVARALSELEQPVVLDADALHELEPGEWRAPAVLTPHAGELGRLLGETSAWVDAHRLEAARRAAERFGCVCLLKGADTIVAAPGERTLICPVDAPALATAGTGDVLTGVLAAYLAKGVEPQLAAAAAATIHGLAARATPATGAIASDVVAALPSIRG
ncbi:MAG TPA: NAD(P)H-hydrate dehydratase [Gaiellaceae bacterium]|nr:NAD(P)H-hydrate dehydratase [Gaiellaceae bacterium]